MNDGLIDQWVRYRRRRGLAATTIRDGRRELGLLQAAFDDLASIDDEDILDWLDDRGIANPDTRNVYLSQVSAFYRWAIRHGHAATNPVDRIDRPRRRRGVPRPFPIDDLDHALIHADPAMRAILLCGVLAGMRCREIAGLARADILDRDQLIVITHGKGGHERAVHLHSALAEALRRVPLPRGGPIFPGRDGGHRRPGAMSHHVNRYLRSLDITSTCHQLRHLFASQALDACHDLRVVQELLGHRSPDTTAIYAGFSQHRARAAVEAIQIGAA